MTELNIGNLDRLLRIVVGLALVACAATGLLGAWAWIGIVPILTGVVAWCPLYSLLGLRTTER
jgi:hypothetical protein